MRVLENCHQKGRLSGADRGKIEWKSTEVYIRAVSREQNKLIGEFKMVGSDVISIRGKLWSTCTFQQELNGSW